MIKCTSEIIFTLDSITVITLSLSLLMSKEYFGDTWFLLVKHTFRIKFKNTSNLANCWRP